MSCASGNSSNILSARLTRIPSRWRAFPTMESHVSWLRENHRLSFPNPSSKE